MKKLYLECYSGISGDMMVAALLDLGADQEVLKDALRSLNVSGYTTEISRVKKSGLDVCDFSVKLDAKHENHDHDMEYLHGEHHVHTHDHEHSHDEGHTHVHEHSHDEHHDHEHTHPHEHRNLTDIKNIITASSITDRAKELALKIFDILAVAEAEVHGSTPDQVHFHEVGAVDSIVDIVAVAVCLDNLNIEEVIIPVLYEGTGFVRCQHGMMPIPVPAVAAIVKNHGLSLRIQQIQGEFVTPTGAAIAAAIRTSEVLPAEFTLERTGIGAGKRNYERPSLLRAMLISEKVAELPYLFDKTETICKLESNIDDCTGEALGFVMDKLLRAGARDVYYIPIYMKKNRPAYQLTVICKEKERETLEEIIFTHTTTIGIRRQYMERTVLKRELMTIDTSLGKAQVKVCNIQGKKRVYPEYQSVAGLCEEHKMSFHDVFLTIEKEGYDLLQK